MKKILLMGSANVGKTSMYSILFCDFPAKDTHKIGYTNAEHKHQLQLMGNFTFSLWDCGGCDTFMNYYFMQLR